VTLQAGELIDGLVPPEGLRFHIREAMETAGSRWRSRVSTTRPWRPWPATPSSTPSRRGSPGEAGPCCP